MNPDKFSVDPLYSVVINNEGQYSLWLLTGVIPPGWNRAGFQGNKVQCLSFIKNEWTDMSPLSMRKSAASPSGYSSNGLAHRYFEEQAEITPDAVAVVSGNKRITYAVLHQYSNQIGNYLQSIGIGPEKAVGLCVGRSLEMIAGFLGILKSGGVYVPLDPLYPAERLKNMAREAHLSALLVQNELFQELIGSSVQICCLERDQNSIKKQSIQNVTSFLHPENLSHIIFTSGSTGVPKGVMMPHASLCRNLKGFLKSVTIRPDDIYLHTASLAFTSSLRQILAPLTSGATIVIADQEERTDPVALFRLIQREYVTIWDTVAPFWETCAKSFQQRSPDVLNKLLQNRLRIVLSSGGELPNSLVQTWRKLTGHNAGLVNMYGQTETVGNILINNIQGQLDTTPQVIPLGPPNDNTRIYLLDENVQLTQPGSEAQIHVGGGVLARGYLNQPDLTAERYIPDPFSGKPGARLFKTGDRGYLLPDETICFTGRIDFQVNIRGFRIELGEVEAALKLHDGISAAIVDVFEDSAGRKELIGYFETEPGGKIPSVDDMREFLAGKIPSYMIPLKYQRLESLPRLPNGKINRQSLPPWLPKQGRPELSSTYIAPGNPTERAIAVIWQEVLDLDRVGIMDNFFDLGGNSLLAAQVIDRQERYFTMEFPVALLFEKPTVHSLSEFIRQKCSEIVDSQASFDRGKKRKAHRAKRSKSEPDS